MVIGILLVASFSLLSLSASPTGHSQVSFSITTEDLGGDPLNYSAYLIQSPSIGTITLLYTFPQDSGSGTVNLSSTLSKIIITNSSTSATSCGGSYNGTSVQCGANISTTATEMTYYPGLVTSVTFTITALNSLGGDYFFFPPGSACGTYIVLIVGDLVPTTIPSIPFLCGFRANGVPYPNANISVQKIDNLTGFNLST
jgi:hypothetical protein